MEGKARTKLLDHSSSLVEGLAGGPSWEFIYQASLTKHPDYNIGDRVALPDGRVFRYGFSSGACNVDVGVKFTDDEFQGYSTILVAGAVGDSSVQITGSTHIALTKDSLRGGYVIIFHTGGGGDTQFRGIVGNPAADEDADFTLYLDAGLDHATIAASTGVEVFPNPYAALATGALTGRSHAGKAAVHVDAASMYFWVQTWGPCWMAPNTTDGTWATNYHRGAYWRNDGAIMVYQDLTDLDADNTTQYAGFLIGEGYSSGPLFMLQVSP